MHLRTIAFSRSGPLTTLLVLAALWTRPAAAQVDQQRAREYFKEAAALCQREGGRLWGVSLCGPIAIADPGTGTLATSEPPPDAPRPAALGFANAAMDWGGRRWTTLVWQTAFPDARKNEHALEINEGLAHYTGVVAGTASGAQALEAALALLDGAEARETFVRTFPYVSGPAYGLLLDAVSPRWTRRFSAADEPARLLMKAADVAPAADAHAAARRYGGEQLRSAEEARAAAHAARVAELRRRFVDGPVIVLPRPRSAAFVTTGMVPIPGAGTVYPTYRTKAEWGTLEAANVLVSADRTTIALPAPASPAGPTVKGEGWALTLATGWTIRPGAHAGDFVVARE